MAPIKKKNKLSPKRNSEIAKSNTASSSTDITCVNTLDLITLDLERFRENQQHQERKSKLNELNKKVQEIILKEEAQYCLLQDAEQLLQQATLGCKQRLEEIKDLKRSCEEESNKIEEEFQDEM